MVQFLWNIVRSLAARRALSAAERWRRDPLAHPTLGRMSERELADLPIGHPVLPRRLMEGDC